MDRGYIKLWRKIKNSPVFLHDDHELFRVWILLLLTATYKEIQEPEGSILRGQVLTNKEDLQAKMFPTGGNYLSERCCWKLLKTLEDMNNIQVEEDENLSIVTITNWEVYQAREAHAHRGYFRLWRKIIDSDVFMVPELLKLWVYCLASASYEEVFVIPEHRAKKTAPLDTGQFVVGRNKLRADLFGRIHRGTPSAVTCWRWLQRLAETKAISIGSSGSFSVVTINNWSAHQG